MKSLKIFLTISILLVLCARTFSQDYSMLSSPKKIDSEVYYILPQSALSFDLPIILDQLILSRKYKSYPDSVLIYYQQHYGLDVSKYKSLEKSKVIKSISLAEDSIKISMQPVPDPSKVVYISSKSNWNKKQTIAFEYGVDGMISTGQSSREDITYDIAVKSLSAIATVASAVAKSRYDNVPDDIPDSFKMERLDMIISKIEKLNSMPPHAFETYKALMLMQEKLFKEEFERIFYSEKRKYIVNKIVYVPNKALANSSSIPFFVLDTLKLLIFNKDLESDLFGKNLQFHSFDSLTNKSYILSFVPAKPIVSTLFNARPIESTNFAYNLPQKTIVNVYNQKKSSIFCGVLSMAQFGIVGAIESKRKNLSFTLDPITGELRKIGISKNNSSTEQVSSTSASAAELFNALKSEDADTKLDKEVKRLENEIKKRDLTRILNEGQ